MYALLFILFILLILVIVFIISICGSDKFNKVEFSMLRSYIGGSPNNKDAISMQGRSRTNSIEFDRRRTEMSGKDATAMQAQSAVMRYTISGEINGLDFSQLRTILKDTGIHCGIPFEERPINEKVHISFGSLGNFNNKSGFYHPDFYKQHAAIKNVLTNHSSFISKTELYKTIKKVIPLGIKFIPETYSMKAFNTAIHGSTKLFESNNLETPQKGESNLSCGVQPLIVKKDGTFGQQGVRVIENMADFTKAKKELNLNEGNAIISKYITNPITIDGKKFHLRVYLLLSVISGIIRCSAHNEYKIYAAEDQYKDADWLNTKIHITGVSGKSKNKRYVWPDDVDWPSNDDRNQYLENINECISVLCLALAMSNVKNYENESNAGYHLYGVDILITKTGVFILEINRRPGFKMMGGEEGWAVYNAKFSYNLYSFILSNTVFPYFGIKRMPIQHAAFIGDGELSPFGGIFTGKNSFTLIPLTDASESELNAAKKFHFYSEKISLLHFISICDPYNIFLIGKENSPPIGYITLEVVNNKYIMNIAIIKEFQNRGIATAMIAQLLEIYSARNYVHHGQINSISFIKTNMYLNKIANKLHFIENRDYYERKFKIHNKINNIQNSTVHKLTYKIINDDDDGELIPLHLHMTKSYSQFVHFVFNNINLQKLFMLKHSTGLKYNEEFIYQGAELKSVLNIRTLYHINIFRYWYSIQSFADLSKNSFLGISNIHAIESNPDQFYWVFNYKNKSYNLTNYKELKPLIDEEDSKIYIAKYYPLFILDKNIMIVKLYFIIYMSGNGVIKYFFFKNKKNVVHFKNVFMNEYGLMLGSEYLQPKDIPKKYNWPDDFKSGELAHIANDETIIQNIADKLLDIFMKSPIEKYNECNAGFLPFSAGINFSLIDGKYTPMLSDIFNYCKVINNLALADSFIKQYYEWLKDSVIYPHFGIPTTNRIYPNRISIDSVDESIRSHLDIDILSKLLLHMSMDKRNIDIYFEDIKCGTIKFDVIYDPNPIIKITHMKVDKKNIELHAIFILMDIIAAYYAPLSIPLMLEDKQEMHSIAYKLQFYKTTHTKEQITTQYFIKNCR